MRWPEHRGSIDPNRNFRLLDIDSPGKLSVGFAVSVRHGLRTQRSGTRKRASI
jgi:hypothetical protein